MSLPKIVRRCVISISLGAMMLACVAAANAQETAACTRIIKADVVAFDQPFFYNRLGAVNPAGMIYALRRDVKPKSGTTLSPGNVVLKDYKRARPIVLRMNVNDCIQISFQNLLDPNRANKNQPNTRTASIHVEGMQLRNSILDDGSNVGINPSSLVAPGQSIVYTLFAQKEGNHLLYSTAATTSGQGNGGTLPFGLFGSLNVEAKTAEWYRSQITELDMRLAQKKNADGTPQVTPNGQPVLNYDAVYPPGQSRPAGTPILKMLDANFNIVHSDLNAIITGPGRGPFNHYPPNPVEPDRNQPFREFTTVYHDEIFAVQAFPQFEESKEGEPQNPLAFTLHSVRDAFAINYGTGGIGAEILANRFGVGPMAKCTECLFEEFFLSSFTVGDPAMIVDIPANTRDANGNLIPGFKATKAFFPDDPSNVHHSYMNDNVKFRVVHAGPKEHHIHHLHAHQWLHTPDSDNSTYLDSQALGPSYAFTTEIAYGGAGNRNKTPGDAIFHCHFYPHFAMGMWELFRVHDVFEAGTKLDLNGRPISTSRRLPDAEIQAGTPIPAVVPIPTIAMAVMPTNTFQGYPFYIEGQVGHRPPTAPLDVIDDGGLSRHIIVGGTAVHHKEHLPQFSLEKARLDFDKSLVTAQAVFLPEFGTTKEKVAMDFHALRTHPSFTPEGIPAPFITNGRPPVKGAPFADPCVNDAGGAAGVPRLYKGANIQLKINLNKKPDWHFKQSRISALWGDVKPTRDRIRPPEPLFFRANTNDCITFHHTNLVPRVYLQDDFQVRTPTDTMGQHIHLVKFDVLASDGAANGWNYEDGTFSPEEVIERIRAIRKFNGCIGIDSGDPRDGTTTCPKAKQHPFFGDLGAQTTVQRWFADDVLNNAGVDRTLRTVFTHDHFGPSTHQQAGLYAGLVVEPKGSKWRHPETGIFFGGEGVPPRFDGGPTSWRADIITSNITQSYREFLLEFADFQLAYDGLRPVNPPAKNEVGLPFLLEPAEKCPGSSFTPPCPEAIAAADVGTMSVNYRNEPIALRVRDPGTNKQAAGLAGNLSHVYRSNVLRADPDFNVQPAFYPPLTADVQPGDPFTPLLRAYENDPVQIRILVGAHEEGHNFGVNGIKWLFEPSDPNSGFRNNQMMGISEHFEFVVPRLPRKYDGKTADYLYQPGKGVDDQWNGLWGLMRVYATKRADLLELPNNPKSNTLDLANQGDFNGVCPKVAPVRSYKVTAVNTKALPQGTLVYNHREFFGGRLHDPTAIMFFRNEDIDPISGQVRPHVHIEPLILRASAGECIQVTLTNKLPPGEQFDLDGFNTLPMIVNRFNANQVKPSGDVGLHPQLVFFDVTRSDGMNVGFNPVQTAAPGQTVTYQWYAGDVIVDANNFGIATPMEFGSTNLSSADPIKHSNKGAIGALIIEPKGSFWDDNFGSRAQVDIKRADGTSFREFVTMFQNDINLRFNGVSGEVPSELGVAVPNLAEAEDPEDSGQKAINYRTEPLWKRMGYPPDTPLEKTREFDYTKVLTNNIVGGEDPVTPVFTAFPGQEVRVRMLEPGGHPRNDNYMLHGHIWEQEPYVDKSQALGTNPLSNWVGSQGGIGPGTHFDFLPKNGAGGAFHVQGDYLYRTFASFQFDGGIWGIFRVSTVPPTCCRMCPCADPANQ